MNKSYEDGLGLKISNSGFKLLYKLLLAYILPLFKLFDYDEVYFYENYPKFKLFKLNS